MAKEIRPAAFEDPMLGEANGLAVGLWVCQFL